MVITGNPFSFREEAIVDFPAPGIPVRQIIIILFFFFISDSFPILLFAVYLVYYVHHSEKLFLIFI
jgi:hypothetical protein